jgi:dipeptidase
MKVALERCKTARCAVSTMGELCERFGFYADGPGTGESVSVIDSREAWVFQVAVGARGKSAAWVAQRVPDDHVAVVANGYTIRAVDVNDQEKFMVGKHLFKIAQEEGLWDGKTGFDFGKIFAPDTMQDQPRNVAIRMWRVYSRLAPSLNIQPHVDPLSFPFSVKVEVPVSHRTLMDMHRDHLEGTEFDLRNGALAGPFRSPNRLEGGAGMLAVPGEAPRAISLPRTAYGVVVQSRPKEVTDKIGSAGVIWYASDAPATSVFVPFYANSSWANAEPNDYGRGSLFKFDRNCAWWAFDFVANWMELNYEHMSQVVVPAVANAQDGLDRAMEQIEEQASQLIAVGQRAEAQRLLSAWQTKAQQDVVDRWWQLADYLLARFNDGFDNRCIDAGGPPRNVDKGEPSCIVGMPIGYPAWWLEQVGFNFDLRPQYAKPAGLTPPAGLAGVQAMPAPAGAPWAKLPSPPVTIDTYWQGTKMRGEEAAKSTAYQAPPQKPNLIVVENRIQASLAEKLFIPAILFAMSFMMAVSFLAGVRYGRRDSLPTYQPLLA